MADSASSNETDEDESSSAEQPPSPGPGRAATLGAWLGPGLALLLLLTLRLCGPDDLRVSAARLVAVTLWMAVWWMTEALPLGVTSLLPLVLFPVLGILPAGEVATCYSVSTNWLFFGGFQLAFALERTGLHRRLAFTALRAVGTRPVGVLLGVMVTVAGLSMFLSNTSTALMILPVAEAMSASVGGERFQKALLLGTAYAASMGGLGSLIGTPPNGVLAAQASIYGEELDFATWMVFAAPLALAMVLFTWLFLAAAFKVPHEKVAAGAVAESLPPCSRGELRAGLVFLLTALAWMVRRPLLEALSLPTKGGLEDSTISMAAVVLLFLVPDGKGGRLMDWATLLKTPWHILFLFGGGFALASGFKATKLSAWLGRQLKGLGGLPTPLLVFLEVLLVTFLTEVTSNTATANVLLPIIGELAKTVGARPLVLMIPGTLAASCAFMLPVATPPNAIVFARQKLAIRDMASAGLVLNLATAGLITVWMFTWGKLWFDVSPAAAE